MDPSFIRHKELPGATPVAPGSYFLSTGALSRHLVYKLRHALPEPDHSLLVDTLTVQWRPDAAFTLDVAGFETALDQATTRAELATALQL